MNAPQPGLAAIAAGLLDRVHHIGINVSDLDRSIAFYRGLFAVEPLFVNDMRGEGLSTGAGVPGADVRFCMMKISNVILEMIEWRSPKLPAPTDEGPYAGGFHIAFEVPDIEAAHATLSARGIEFVAKPHRFVADDAAPAIVGATFVYFKDPEGIGLEIYQKRSRFNNF
jgi:catechol 2,3-dioxygenase-like lactoylglutathione lyase family enzyme